MNLQFRFRRLVKKHQSQLFSLAYHLLGQSAEAEDVVQDVLVKLWQHLPELEAARVKPWLLRVTRNASLDLLRRRRYSQAYVTETVNAGPQVVSESPLERLSSSDLGQRLAEAIRQLDEPYRSLVLLRDVEEMNYREIAEALELSDSQVKVYLHRARRRLRERLGSELDD
ncbi:MAG: sigma-70 family RNA polymerase sigma factor [Pseudomonadota bacterium]